MPYYPQIAMPKPKKTLKITLGEAEFFGGKDSGVVVFHAMNNLFSPFPLKGDSNNEKRRETVVKAKRFPCP